MRFARSITPPSACFAVRARLREREKWTFGGFGGAGGFWEWGWRVAGHLDAEGSGERAEDSAGAGDFGEEGDAFGGGEEMLELEGVAAGVVVVDVADEPGFSPREAGGGEGACRAGTALARLGQGVVAPASDEFFEALDGAAEVVGDADEDFGAGGLSDGKIGDDDLEAAEDGSEEGGDGVHLGE